MKRLLLVLLPISLFVFSCEEEQSEDTTPPTVTITFPQNNSSVSEMVSITCISSDNEGVEKVELWVNGVTTELTDDSEPYSFDWNTTLVDNGNYTITVRSYDLSGNTTDSETLILTVDNTQSNPRPVVLYPTTYNDGFQISWSQNNDDDFKSYKLYESLSEDMTNSNLIYETEEKTDTSHFKTILNYMYYQIITEDIWGYKSTSNIDSSSVSTELWGEYYSIEFTTVLDLSNRGLTGSIPPEIGNLTNLEELYLNNNQLTGSIPQEIGNLTNLMYLDLRDNQLTGSIPQEIGNLTNLIYLDLRDNQLTGSIPSGIGNMTNLEELYLHNNQLTGSIPPEIGNLTNLTRLYLYNNQLSGIIPDEICDLGVLYNNQFCPPYPSCIEYYMGGEQDLSNCEGVVELWGEYYSIEYTTELVLNYKGLTGSIPPEIGTLTNLERLGLSNNQLTGSIPPEIGNLTNLENLDLRENQLTGSIPPEIGNLTNLTRLFLYDNELTGSIPPEIGTLTNLDRLNLTNNQLTGEIPQEIGNLTNLIYLDLWDNQLTGSIPHEIGNLTNLERLDLRDNQLTGEIPQEIGNLTNLSTVSDGLNLSDNQLTGIIPDEICNQGDGSPGLEYNQLCPPYPSCIEGYVGEQDTSNCGD